MENIYTPESYSDSYPQCLKALYDVNNLLKQDGIMAPSESSLDTTQRLYALIGRPLDRIKTIHVGGTNGKGSTSFKIAQALTLSGLRTGLFVSPHLSSFRERVQVNNVLIPEADFLVHMPRVLQLCVEHNLPATLFELTFILACLHFEAQACQAVVLEVGLGGKVDATNVVSTCLAILCSVSLDHTRILGATVEEIAAHKAGIFKHGVDALVGPGCPMAVLTACATEAGANLHTLVDCQAKFNLSASSYSSSSSSSTGQAGMDGDKGVVDVAPLLTNTDDLNAHISLAALCLLKEQGGVFASLEPLHEACQAGIASRPPCRWEKHYVTVSKESGGEQEASTQVQVEVILDVGHNPAAVGALMQRIKKEFIDVGRHVRVLYAMSRDKDVRACLRLVLPVTGNDRIHFAQTDNFRAIAKQELREIYLQEAGQDLVDVAEGLTVAQTVSKVIGLAANDGPNSAVIICGTGYIMPDARRQLGIDEPRDVDDLARV